MKMKITWESYVVAGLAVLLLAGVGAAVRFKDLFFGSNYWERTVVVQPGARQAYLAGHPDHVKVMLLSDVRIEADLEREIAASGVLGGRRLVIDRCDQGATMAEQLALLARVTRDPSYYAVIGPVGSERALHAGTVLALASVPMMPLDAVSPRLTDFPYALMARASAKDEMAQLAKDFATNGVRRLAIVNDDSLDWSTRAAALEDAAVLCGIDVPTRIFFDADEDVSWMRTQGECRNGTTGIALLAPTGGRSTGAVEADLRRRFGQSGQLRVLSLSESDRMEEVRRSVRVFAAVFAAAERAGDLSAAGFVRTARAGTFDVDGRRLAFGADRFLAPAAVPASVRVR